MEGHGEVHGWKGRLKKHAWEGSGQEALEVCRVGSLSHSDVEVVPPRTQELPFLPLRVLGE